MSFKIKITILTTVLVALLYGMGSSILIHRAYMDSITREEKDAVDSIQMVSSIIQLTYENTEEASEEPIIRIIRSLGTYQTSSDVFLLYENKNLVYGNVREQGVDIDIDNISSNLKGQGDIYVSYKNGEAGMEYIISSCEVRIKEIDYTICVCRDISYVRNTRQNLHKIFIYLFILLVVATFVVSYVSSTFLVRHLSRLTSATREISDGNLSYRSQINTNDEIGELSHDFDKMAEKLEQNVNLLEKTAEEKDRFMGAFTHELKTPMTSIIGYSELLRTTNLEDEDREDALNYIYSEAKRLENMSFKLLQLFVVDKEEHDIKEVSPKSMVEDIVAHLKPTLEEQHIQISCTTQEGTAMLEPDLTRTLLLNLIDNSRKAMELDGNSEKVGQISIDQSMIPDGVKYVIKDNGKGMPQESIEHITEAFYRVDKARSRAQGGAGIGMSLVAKIVEIHNGTLDISSEEGVGTTITIELKGGPVKNEG